MKKVDIWVYGTLKRGKALNEMYMKNSKFKCEDTIKGELYKMGWYPAFFKRGKNMTDIKGEIFEMPIEDFNEVRKMEENSGYKTETLTTAKGNKVYTFCYMDSRVKELGAFITEF